jgi:hypothetical protein
MRGDDPNVRGPSQEKKDLFGKGVEAKDDARNTPFFFIS